MSTPLIQILNGGAKISELDEVNRQMDRADLINKVCILKALQASDISINASKLHINQVNVICICFGCQIIKNGAIDTDKIRLLAC